MKYHTIHAAFIGSFRLLTRFANSLYQFTLNNFPGQTSVGVSNPSTFAMDFNAAGTVLYGVTAATALVNPSTLGTISTTTGAFTPIAALTGFTAGQSASGLTIHPVTGDAYLSSTADLFTLNLSTGVATLIGPMAAGQLMVDIAMNCSGQLYGHNIADDALYSINPATGAATLIGNHGLAANFAQGMDFDNDTGTLYGFVYTGGGTNTFGAFNLTTGAITPLATNSPLGEFEGAIPTQCPVPTAVPASSNLGLLLIIFLLLGLGLVAIRR